VQLSYAIGIAKPVSVYVDTFGTSHLNGSTQRHGIPDQVGDDGKGLEERPADDAYIAAKISELFDLRPAAIVERFGLKNPIYAPTAAYGHFGREPYTAQVEFKRHGKVEKHDVQFFAWEKLDAVETLKAAFGLK